MKMATKTSQERDMIIKRYKKVFHDLVMVLNITDTTKNMNDLDEDEYSLINPYSKSTCLMLYLYSLELGVPPLYAEINRVARTGDTTQLLTLGPFIKALGKISEFGDKLRE